MNQPQLKTKQNKKKKLSIHIEQNVFGETPYCASATPDLAQCNFFLFTNLKEIQWLSFTPCE